MLKHTFSGDLGKGSNQINIKAGAGWAEHIGLDYRLIVQPVKSALIENEKF
jgi:hypothetical protein